jgi:hypothetical protein
MVGWNSSLNSLLRPKQTAIGWRRLKMKHNLTLRSTLRTKQTAIGLGTSPEPVVDIAADKFKQFVEKHRQLLTVISEFNGKFATFLIGSLCTGIVFVVVNYQNLMGIFKASGVLSSSVA